MAGKATLYSRHDSAPKHAEYSSSRDRTNSLAHPGKCFGILAKVNGFCRRFTKRYIISLPLFEKVQQTHSDITKNLEYLPSAVIYIQSSYGRRFCDFRKEKKTLFFSVAPFSIDPSELNTNCFGRFEST